MRIRYFDIRDMSAEMECSALTQMSPDKRGRLMRMTNAEARRRSCAGDLLARDLLSEISGIPAQNIMISESNEGKPSAPCTGLQLSISHSGGWVVCAVATAPVGVDTEFPRPFNRPLAEKICGPDELSYIIEDPEARFIRIWTLKEAYGKMTGKGVFTDRVVFGHECRRSEFAALGARFYTLGGPGENITSLCVRES